MTPIAAVALALPTTASTNGASTNVVVKITSSVAVKSTTASTACRSSARMNQRPIPGRRMPVRAAKRG